ncbi:uncharacterized protein TNCV_2774671 [Trichonephila clavipes]|nr:uncharacterized protein TNCV_2774671 [Trichonephila clavipes]
MGAEFLFMDDNARPHCANIVDECFQSENITCPKVLWAESRVQGTGEYFPPIQFHGKIVEMAIGGGAIFCPFGKFLGAKRHCDLYGTQGLGQRQAYF